MAGRVQIALGSLSVGVEVDQIYPDAITDLCSRAQTLFTHALSETQKAGIDPAGYEITDEEEPEA